MRPISEMREEITQKLAECQSHKAELSQKISDLKKAYDDSLNSADSDEYKKAIAELEENASKDERDVLTLRSSLRRDTQRCRSLVNSIFALCVCVAIGIFVFLKIKMAIGNILVYVITAFVGIVVRAIAVEIMTAKTNRQLTKTFNDPRIIEFDKKSRALSAEHKEKMADKKKYRDQLDQERREIEKTLEEVVEAENELKNLLEELDFNYKYKNCILFYGDQGGNKYDLYLDGLLYDTVKGKQIIKIMLSPGLHSFKVDNTHYNIVDGSVDYSYTFNTIQINADDTINAYPIVCEFKKLRQVNGKEFQNITKTTLM